MKVIICFLFFAIACALGIHDADVLRQWTEFQATYRKSYRSVIEAEKRLAIFRTNLEEIQKHNAEFKQGKTTYSKGINKFTDWTKEEFMQFVNKGLIGKPTITATMFNSSKGFSIPASVDWRTVKNVVTDVKDQQFCGSCWAFSATGSLEGQLGLKGNLVSLSEKILIDCSYDQGNQGCTGGLVNWAFDYIQKYGIESESDYPYEGTDWSCKADPEKVVTKISNYIGIQKGSEAELQEAVATKGPISVCFDATEDLQLYQSGIMNELSCDPTNLNHCVLLVGYGSENGTDFYTLKNSWGPGFGEGGYFRLIKNNRCGIADDAWYPVI